MNKKQTNWIKPNFPSGCETLLGYWIGSCENIVIRNFIIENNQCFVLDFDGDWIPSPFPDYWKYFYDEPDWVNDV